MQLRGRVVDAPEVAAQPLVTADRAVPYLALLGEKIREQGFTELEVEEAGGRRA